MGNEEVECRKLIKRSLITHSDILRESCETIMIEKIASSPFAEEEERERQVVRFASTLEHTKTCIPSLKCPQWDDLCLVDVDSAMDTIRF